MESNKSTVQMCPQNPSPFMSNLRRFSLQATNDTRRMPDECVVYVEVNKDKGMAKWKVRI